MNKKKIKINKEAIKETAKKVKNGIKKIPGKISYGASYAVTYARVSMWS